MTARVMEIPLDRWVDTRYSSSSSSEGESYVFPSKGLIISLTVVAYAVTVPSSDAAFLAGGRVYGVGILR